MAIKKWKDVEDTLRAEGFKFGFSQLMTAVTDGLITCTKLSDGLWLEMDQARAWAIEHNKPRNRKKHQDPQLFDSTEQLRRIADAVERIEALLKP